MGIVVVESLEKVVIVCEKPLLAVNVKGKLLAKSAYFTIMLPVALPLQRTLEVLFTLTFKALQLAVFIVKTHVAVQPVLGLPLA